MNDDKNAAAFISKSRRLYTTTISHAIQRRKPHGRHDYLRTLYSQPATRYAMMEFLNRPATRLTKASPLSLAPPPCCTTCVDHFEMLKIDDRFPDEWNDL